jgi:hypothetical protein
MSRCHKRVLLQRTNRGRARDWVVGIEKQVDAHGMTRDGAGFSIIDFSSLLLRLFIRSFLPCLGLDPAFPFHILRKSHITLQNNGNRTHPQLQTTISIHAHGQLVPGSLSFPFLSSLYRSRCGSAEWTQFFLMCCVCYFPYVQFGLFFSRSNTCPPW